MTNTAPAILHELTAIKEYIAAVQSVLASGRMPEMIGLEQRIADLCTSIQTSDKKTQDQCLPELKTLLENINACEDDLRNFHKTHMQPSGSAQ